MTFHLQPANMGSSPELLTHRLIRHMPDWVQEIVRDTCRKHGVPIYDLMSPDQTRKVAMARREAMYRVKAAKPMTPATRLGRWFRRDHTTVIYALARYQQEHGAPALTRFGMGRRG